MPHNKSCRKRLQTSRKRNERNRQNRALMRSRIKVFRANIEQMAQDDKPETVASIHSLIDTQARKGLMPKKRAARLKSRMAAAAAK